MSNFQPLEVVGRGSETQLQVGENLSKLTWQDNGKRDVAQRATLPTVRAQSPLDIKSH